VKFEWDRKKADINLKKHTVSFDKAQTVFDDKWNSFGEQRELIIGYSNDRRLLIVSFTERLSEVIRVIGARQTTTRERKDYENYRSYRGGSRCAF